MGIITDEEIERQNIEGTAHVLAPNLNLDPSGSQSHPCTPAFFLLSLSEYIYFSLLLSPEPCLWMRQLHGCILGSEATAGDCLLRADEKHDQRCKSYEWLSTFSGPGAVLGHWEHWETGIMTPSLLTRKTRLRKGSLGRAGQAGAGIRAQVQQAACLDPGEHWYPAAGRR